MGGPWNISVRNLSRHGAKEYGAFHPVKIRRDGGHHDRNKFLHQLILLTAHSAQKLSALEFEKAQMVRVATDPCRIDNVLVQASLAGAWLTVWQALSCFSILLMLGLA